MDPDLLIDQLALERVVGQVGVGCQLHLVQDPRAICADCLDRQQEFISDGLEFRALCKLEENLELPL